MIAFRAFPRPAISGRPFGTEKKIPSLAFWIAVNFGQTEDCDGEGGIFFWIN
jgi:hypothetical protein